MTPRSFAALLCTPLVACGSDLSPTGDGGTPPYALAVAGDAELLLHPGDERTLHVLLAENEVGPVASARIHFELQGPDPAGSRIDAADVITDDDGIATVHFTAGARAGGAPFQLTASAPGLAASPVSFTVTIAAQRRMLEIVPTAATRVAADGRSGTTLAGVFASVALRVRESDADTGDAIVGDRISFVLPDVASSRWSATSDRTATVRTGAGGEARVYLITAAAAEGPWRVSAQPAAGGAPVTFTVTVQSGASSCTSNAQCGPGQVCKGDPGRCEDDDAACDASRPCPPGRVCAGGVCEPLPGDACDPAAPACGAGQCCDAGALVCRDACEQSCAEGTHCQPGAACGEGACVRDDVVPDLTGVWLTRHQFNLRDALP